MISLSNKELEPVSSHVHCIDSHMDEDLHPIGKGQSTCVSGLRHDNADLRVRRSYHCRIGRLDCHTVSHDFLGEYIIIYFFNRNHLSA